MKCKECYLTVAEIIAPKDARINDLELEVAAYKRTAEEANRTHITMHNTIVELQAALQALMRMDVKGHQLQDRLQFSTPSRALLNQCRAAIGKAEEA